MRLAAALSRSADPSSFAASFAATVVLAVGLLAALTFWRDPYWVFRDSPPWTRGGAGASRLLDVEMRLIKPLQIARLKPQTLLIGSSVVYRGLDPRDVSAAAGQVYNAGFSALMARELPTLAALAVDIGSVRQVVIALDYFMFTAWPPPPPIDRKLATASGRREALISTVLNPKTIDNLRGRRVLRTEPGLWHVDGYKATPDFDTELVGKISREQNIAAMVYRPDDLAHLERALDLLRGRDVTIVLSPMSAAQRQLIADGGRASELAAWQRDIAALATRRGLPFHDLVSGHPFEDFDPAKASSRYWLDTLHFKPEVGRWLLGRIGLGRHRAGA
ncbi:hypothetical protein [Bosea sp. ANAM02]|uniref:hypothetical protein n=1 Tax=Bosea sp. ANAM02 TaxID=2020412 RepID=UPI00140F1112|nr:hypothetical protein [Bosea sp. ANAM02]BCB19010.1 hypothetical protein OCUBac02_19040 [Bosea sp. ANAM02]